MWYNSTNFKKTEGATVYKKILMKVFLPLLPATAVALATTENSVTVYNVPAQTVETFSYFPATPVHNLQMCTALAAILAVVALVFTVIFVVSGKRWSNRVVFYTAFASTFAAACPPMVRGDVVVVPNAIFPILMAVVCVLSYLAGKQTEVKIVEPSKLGKH